MRNIRQNLFFAFIYNALGVPVAAGVPYPLTGLLLNPMIAGTFLFWLDIAVFIVERLIPASIGSRIH